MLDISDFINDRSGNGCLKRTGTEYIIRQDNSTNMPFQ